MLAHDGQAFFKFSIQMFDLFEKTVSDVAVHGLALFGHLSFKLHNNLLFLNNALSELIDLLWRMTTYHDTASSALGKHLDGLVSLEEQVLVSEYVLLKLHDVLVDFNADLTLEFCALSLSEL